MTPSLEPPTDTFDVKLPRDPYPGLRPFEPHEWPIFFGREKMADEVIGRLIRDHFVVVHGDSGCGKSSLLRAGVFARLEQDNARGGLRWRTCTTQPRDAPLQHLAEALAALDGHKGDEQRTIAIRRVLNFGSDAPSALAGLLRHAETDHICILVDQFEELFAFARRHGPDEARLFVQFLVGLVEQAPPGLYAVVTMRSEFLGACAQFSGLAEAVNRTQYLLPRMAHADVLRAIQDPASIYGGRVSPELAERLTIDAGRRQDQLPLIQHGLMALYRRKLSSTNVAPLVSPDPPPDPPIDETSGPDSASGHAWRLELADYTAVGDLAQLLSDHADELCDEVQHLDTVERLFRALTDINAEGQAIRRPQTVARLIDVTGVDMSTLQRITGVFREEGASFLTPYGRDPLEPTTLMDISHEALIRCWGRLSDAKDGWLVREFRDGLVWRSLLVQADSFDRDPSNILSAATAEDRETWLAERNAAWAEWYGGGWDRVERLVRASVKAGRAARSAEAALAELKIAALAERNRQQRGTIFLVVGLAMLLVGLVALAWTEKHDADNERSKAVALTMLADEQARIAQRQLVSIKKILASIPDKDLRERLALQYMPGELKSLTNTEQTRLAVELLSTHPDDRAQARKPAQYGLKLWATGATLRVKFIDGTSKQHERIALIAQEWTRYANLRFQFGVTEDAEIRVAFAPSDGSWAYVGTDALGIPKDQPTMNLGLEEVDGTVLHEFGHVLGLIHESSNPKAKLPWNKDAVYHELGDPPNLMSKEAVDMNFFNQPTGVEYREFDPDSIMMYALPATWFKDGRARGGNKVLSNSDKEFIARLYPGK